MNAHADLTDHHVRDLLESHGLAPTIQRVAVARWVLNSRSHPSAEEVVDAMRAQGVGVSQATVYNTLGSLVDVGLLARVQRVGDNVRYDGNTSRHHHFFDIETGRLHDIDDDALRVIVTDNLPDGIHIERVSVLIEGRFDDSRRASASR